MPKKSKEPTPEYDSQRETRVLLEDIRGEVKVVAEQHGDIMEKLEEHDTKFERVEQRFDRLEVAVMANSRQMQELKTGQEKLQVDVGTLQVDVESLQSGQKRVEQKLDTALDNHEKRIKNLEAKVGL